MILSEDQNWGNAQRTGFRDFQAWPSTEQSQPASLGLMFPAFRCQRHLRKSWSDGSKVSHSLESPINVSYVIKIGLVFKSKAFYQRNPNKFKIGRSYRSLSRLPTGCRRAHASAPLGDCGWTLGQEGWGSHHPASGAWRECNKSHVRYSTKK